MSGVSQKRSRQAPPSPSKSTASSSKSAASEVAGDAAGKMPRGRNMLFSLSGIALFGLSVWALLALRLHSALQYHEGESARNELSRRSGSLRAENVASHSSSQTKVAAKAPRKVTTPGLPKWHTKAPKHKEEDEEAADMPSLAGASIVGSADSAGMQFALIPRPQFLQSLRPMPADSESPGSVSLWWVDSMQQLPLEGTQAKYALAAFEQALNVTAEAFNSPKLSPLGGVAVAIQPDRKAARDVCAALAGFSEIGGYKGQDNVPEDEFGKASDWHFAVRWDGRLAVCSTAAAGVFRFAATLRQLLAQNGNVASLPNFLVEDWPRHGWRGLHLDAVRHFMPVPFVKQYLTAMAYYKANSFHWHLADDQAFRLLLPRRPKLVESSAETSPEYYSQEDVHEIISFASSLFITVIPVIETPGHVLAALAAYPELACKGDHFEVPKTREGTYYDVFCVGKASTFEFAKDVFTDVSELFPGKYIHIGGDETPPEKWANSPHVKAFAGMAGLKNLGPDVMEAWFCLVGRILRDLGREPIMWDDHFPERQTGKVTKMCPDSEDEWIVQAWKMQPPVGEFSQAAISQNFPFRSIASPMRSVYLDYPVASIDFNKSLDLLPTTGPLILGGCATMWTEDSKPEDVGAKVYPRYMAIAERLWGGAVKPDQGRPLDHPLWVAAHQHCETTGPLPSFLGFKCGKFALRAGGRSAFWKEARVSTNLDSFAKEFGPERALDEEEETYFWAISPKSGDYFEVTLEDHKGRPGYGKWLKHIRVQTGSKDRPGDQLESAALKVAQWVKASKETSESAYQLRWKTVGKFSKGVSEAEGEELLLQGPTAVIRIVATASQMKWMAMPEITVEEAEEHPEHPSVEEITPGFASETGQGSKWPSSSLMKRLTSGFGEGESLPASMGGKPFLPDHSAGDEVKEPIATSLGQSPEGRRTDAEPESSEKMELPLDGHAGHAGHARDTEAPADDDVAEEQGDGYGGSHSPGKSPGRRRGPHGGKGPGAALPYAIPWLPTKKPHHKDGKDKLKRVPGGSSSAFGFGFGKHGSKHAGMPFKAPGGHKAKSKMK
eukprot:TRINITY_DN105715_c0_g1_i1.p1 TRINITY_DN105715_c0_g1~~TRINITY_DN105715_c0_g1_i1.p1  ORF type:complete len:1063 (+),score=236.81 TRINITY_DN105715_c0_g1_i1:23-3211(+)